MQNTGVMSFRAFSAHDHEVLKAGFKHRAIGQVHRYKKAGSDWRLTEIKKGTPEVIPQFAAAATPTTWMLVKVAVQTAPLL